MKITRLQVKNFRGIEALDTSIAPSGAVISGKNAAGKTSVLRAIQAALAAKGVDPTAIRIGADKAELTVDLDDVSVRRVITAKGNAVTVTNKDGFRATKPQSVLDDLLGGSTIDPVDLFLAPAKERRRQILAALPVTVTTERLRKWVPGLPETFDCSGHGLEVLERVRKAAYDKRTGANAAAKKAKDDAERALSEAAVASTAAPAANAQPVDVARQLLAEATDRLTRIRAQADEAKRSEARTANARQRIADLRAKAVELQPAPVELAEEYEGALNACDAAEEEVERLRTLLRQAEEAAERAHSRERSLYAKKSQHDADAKRRAELETQAAEMEETLRDALVEAPTDDQVAGAQQALANAELQVANAEAAEHAKALTHRAKELAGAADVAEIEATRLDGIVRALTNEAPAELLAESNAIPGLAIDGDTILLDGRAIDALSGAEQMRFAVDIAKRLNAKTKLLLCDGLERLDPEAMEQFLAFATEGGWQILATRVASGERVIEAIEATDVAEAAE